MITLHLSKCELPANLVPSPLLAFENEVTRRHLWRENENLSKILSCRILSPLLNSMSSSRRADNFGVFCWFAGHESEGEDSEPDLFQCGKCKRMFTSLQKYLKHKAAKDCVQLQIGQSSTISPVTNGEVFTWSSFAPRPFFIQSLNLARNFTCSEP